MTVHSVIEKQMKKIFFITLLSALAVSSILADHYPRNPNIDIQHYTFKLTLSDTTDEITGEASVEVKFLTAGTTGFNLDLVGRHSASSEYGMTVHYVELKDQEIPFKQEDDKLEISLPAHPAKDEVLSFKISYSGVPADGLIISKDKYGERTFFGDNWPDRAHYWLPTIDHPYDKATCDFIITAPAKYQVIANGSLVEETDLNNGMRLTHWRESVPIPTKVMVIGAARFAVQYLKKFNCIPVETWVYPQDRQKGFYDFEPAEKIVKLFTNLIGPFPYEKLANVESKTKYGGMENASNIFYSEQEVTGTRRSEVTVAHEIAHQWFGDAVSEEDWNHIWLSEGFATFFQDVFIENQFGRDSLINALKYQRQLVVRYDAANPFSPVVDTTITDLNNLLNINSYQKGAWVLRMLQHVVGDKDFWKGIRLYYKTYMNQNALTRDFQKIMEEASGMDLSWFFSEWVYKPGLPYLNGKWSYNSKDKTVEINIEQAQPYDNIFKMPADVAIYLKQNNEPAIKRINIGKKDNSFYFKTGAEPENIILDPGTWILMKAELRKK